MKLSDLRDDFADGIQADAWSAAQVIGSGTKAETGGQARFTLPNATAGSHFAYYRTDVAHPYDMTGDAATINIDTMVSTAVTATAFLDVLVDGQNFLRWRQVSGTLTARTAVAGVDTQLFTTTWNATTHKYLRIRESGGFIFWDTSSNGTSWTQRTTVANPFAITAVFVQFGCSCANVANPGSLRIEEYNPLIGLATNWHATTAQRSLINRFRQVTLSGTSGQFYLATAAAIDASGALVSPQYWSGPLAGDGRTLTSQASQAAAQVMAVNIAAGTRFDLPSQIEARYIRIYHRSITGSSYRLDEYYPRRLLQGDDVEAETIRGLHIAAGTITADKLSVISLSAISAYMGSLTMDGPIDITTGYITGGGGVIKLDVNGLALTVGASYLDTQSYRLVKADGTTFGGLGGTYNTGVHHTVELRSKSINSESAGMFLYTQAASGMNARFDIQMASGLFNYPVFTAQNDGTTHSVVIDALNTSGTIRLTSPTKITEGLNLGTASGAIAGELRASDKIRLNGVTGHSMQMRLVSVANNATAQLCNNATETGLVLIVDASGATSMFALTGGGHGVAEVSDPYGQFSVTAGTAASSNVYWSAGNSRYEIENKRGSTIAYQMYLFVNS